MTEGCTIIPQSADALLRFCGSALGFVSVGGRRMPAASNLLSLPGQHEGSATSPSAKGA